MKNVTGYDLSKLMTGSFGTLAVMDEITLKTTAKAGDMLVLARPGGGFCGCNKPDRQSLCNARTRLSGDSASRAGSTGWSAGGGGADSPASSSCGWRGISISIADRLSNLQRLTGGDSLETQASEALRAKIRDVKTVCRASADIWKISCPPAAAASLISTIKATHEISYFADWAGGLVWMTGGGDRLGADLRHALSGLGGGFAMLVRDAGTTRRTNPPFSRFPARCWRCTSV